MNDFPVSDPREYNPLGIEELGRSAVRKLMEYPSEEPIYVGKAEPRGQRQGRGGTSCQSPILHRRLREHATSVEAVNNLSLSDFRCRWLVLDPVWIGLTEQVLIAVYRPIWNSVVDGFGNHDPGSGRRNQRRSPWDTLHKGRPWAEGLRGSQFSVDQIMGSIALHRAGRNSA